MSERFFENISARYGDVLYGAVRGAAFLHLIHGFVGIDQEESVKRMRFVQSLNLRIVTNPKTGETALSLEGEEDGKILNSIDFDSVIRIGDDLLIRRNGEPESDFEFLALNVLTAVSMVLISENLTQFDFSKFKKRVTKIFKYPCADLENGFLIKLPDIKGIDTPFLIACFYEVGDIVVHFSNGISIEDGEDESVMTQESLRLAINGAMFKSLLENEDPTEEFENFYDRIESIFLDILKDFTEEESARKR